jgi:hypothetical protein
MMKKVIVATVTRTGIPNKTRLMINRNMPASYHRTMCRETHHISFKKNSQVSPQAAI